ncbi:DNA-directed RNA polymerase subunit omega [Psychroflexus maritimus]|uniref:DNA-directed RNA polymerase subunit omega n=1 Tax=Psychroflexus maritimus TaxID=2714865 RepID=A0A967ADM5_9FLAO|nr:DNA-directed RNA polymerase subunit omega [Psychroflexus maritimus]NGZ90312.1 DNA-directed RNA polymerase subunit omega [Psychroflexus maritimus]
MNTNLKDSNAALSTKTYNRNEVDKKTDNIYEAISIVSKRSEQINSEVKRELIEKLEEFATHNDSLNEVFENKEQIEVSKFYERLPKAHALALQEWLEDKIYYRKTDSDLEA